MKRKASLTVMPSETTLIYGMTVHKLAQRRSIAFIESYATRFGWLKHLPFPQIQ